MDWTNVGLNQWAGVKPGIPLPHACAYYLNRVHSQKRQLQWRRSAEPDDETCGRTTAKNKLDSNCGAHEASDGNNDHIAVRAFGLNGMSAARATLHLTCHAPTPAF